MPKIVHEELMCCGYKKCPTVTVFEDGSMEIRDNDTEAGSVGTIKLRPEQIDRLIEIRSKSKEA